MPQAMKTYAKLYDASKTYARNLNKIVLKAGKLVRNNTKVLIFAKDFTEIELHQYTYL